jgi:hypothetical protein
MCALADRLEREGGAGFADYGAGASRLQLKRKDPQAYKVFFDLLSSHSTIGSANTMRGVQAGRPPIYVWEKEMDSIRIPTLILCGDEDEACIAIHEAPHPRQRPGLLPQERARLSTWRSRTSTTASASTS